MYFQSIQPLNSEGSLSSGTDTSDSVANESSEAELESV